MKVVYITIGQREECARIEAEQHNGERVVIPVALRSYSQQTQDIHDTYGFFVQQYGKEPHIAQITYQDLKGQTWTGTCATEHGISKIFRQVEEQVIDELSYREW